MAKERLILIKIGPEDIERALDDFNEFMPRPRAKVPGDTFVTVDRNHELFEEALNGYRDYTDITIDEMKDTGHGDLVEALEAVGDLLYSDEEEKLEAFRNGEARTFNVLPVSITREPLGITYIDRILAIAERMAGRVGDDPRRVNQKILTRTLDRSFLSWRSEELEEYLPENRTPFLISSSLLVGAFALRQYDRRSVLTLKQ